MLEVAVSTSRRTRCRAEAVERVPKRLASQHAEAACRSLCRRLIALWAALTTATQAMWVRQLQQRFPAMWGWPISEIGLSASAC